MADSKLSGKNTSERMDDHKYRIESYLISERKISKARFKVMNGVNELTGFKSRMQAVEFVKNYLS
jgi:hypothetical protein